MSNTRKEVFIQNLKDTSTVLQQLRVCIEAVKDCLNSVDDLDKLIKELDIENLEQLLLDIQQMLIDADLPNIAQRITALENHNLYEYDIALSFEDDNRSYYVETTIIDDNDHNIGDLYQYSALINILHLGQACFESNIGDPCVIYGINQSAIEFMWYNGESFTVDATPENLACSITTKRKIY